MLRKILTITILLLALAGCGSSALLTNVSVSPGTISPHTGSTNAATTIQYSLSRPATISIYLVDGNHAKHPLREKQARAAGDYQILFGGIVNDRMLPDGVYQLAVEANDEAGHTETVPATLKITGADTTLPELQNFSVFPDTFTPNQDGIDDRVSIRYYLTKPAHVTVYLTDGKTRYPIDERKETTVLTEDGYSAIGPHEYDYDAGIDLGATPPPDGAYTVVAESVDAVGNIVRAEHPLTIKDGGSPRAAIIGSAGNFSPLVVPLNSTLYFSATVQNVGTVPIRTKGPEPGFVYSTNQNYSVIQQYEEPGIWRIGVESEGNSIGRQYPYRWQLGSSAELKHVTINGKEYLYLLPGQAVRISGGIKIVDKPPLVNPHYWLGLVQEQVRLVEDHVEPTQITVDY